MHGRDVGLAISERSRSVSATAWLQRGYKFSRALRSALVHADASQSKICNSELTFFSGLQQFVWVRTQLPRDLDVFSHVQPSLLTLVFGDKGLWAIQGSSEVSLSDA